MPDLISPAGSPAMARLTPRERQIVQYLAAGKPNKVVAIDLGISLRTAEAHRARIFRKLGVRNTLELACRLCRHGGGQSDPSS
ncbi:response regulator transcription factor [Bordetella petrii]|uniref:response regulator transcription factor n=1 Tax=Bordetella petrii TaxID=94624 RepID=UPI001E47CD7C|nr:LuxR C-terminal-related transcriptional regulator [Bordetella petrii]MCD0504653.1 LuxR C-terminal-related transcriptional regulator [Bordetella petrii]